MKGPENTASASTMSDRVTKFRYSPAPMRRTCVNAANATPSASSWWPSRLYRRHTQSAHRKRTTNMMAPTPKTYWSWDLSNMGMRRRSMRSPSAHTPTSRPQNSTVMHDSTNSGDVTMAMGSNMSRTKQQKPGSSSSCSASFTTCGDRPLYSRVRSSGLEALGMSTWLLRADRCDRMEREWEWCDRWDRWDLVEWRLPTLRNVARPGDSFASRGRPSSLAPSSPTSPPGVTATTASSGGVVPSPGVTVAVFMAWAWRSLARRSASNAARSSSSRSCWSPFNASRSASARSSAAVGVRTREMAMAWARVVPYTKYTAAKASSHRSEPHTMSMMRPNAMRNDSAAGVDTRRDLYSSAEAASRRMTVDATAAPSVLRRSERSACVTAYATRTSTARR